MQWLPIVPAGVLVVAVLIDSVLRRGKTGFLWILCFVIGFRFYIDSPEMNRIANENPSYAAGRITAICVVGLIIYYSVTIRQKKVSNCRNCGKKLTLFNRDLSEGSFCAQCGKIAKKQK